MSARAQRFVEVNRQHGVVSGEWLTSQGRPVTREGPELWAKLRYRFENGQTITLVAEDRDALFATGFEPRWKGQQPTPERKDQ